MRLSGRMQGGRRVVFSAEWAAARLKQRLVSPPAPKPLIRRAPQGTFSQWEKGAHDAFALGYDPRINVQRSNSYANGEWELTSPDGGLERPPPKYPPAPARRRNWRAPG